MKKIIALLLCLILSPCEAFADKNMDQLFNEGVGQYKEANYVGSMQTMEEITEEDPGNALAHYYLAISYVQVGLKDKAIKSYNDVLALNASPGITSYAQRGLACLQDPDECNKKSVEEIVEEKVGTISKDLGQTLVAPISNTVKEMIKQQKLNKIKDVVNSGKDVDDKLMDGFDDFSQDVEKKSSNDEPTSEEIAKAVKVLAKVGLNPYGNTSMANIDPKQMQMNMLMKSMGGSMGANPMASGNNMNMLPLMMMMQNGNSKDMDPTAMQSMINGMLMPDMGMFSAGNNNN